MTKIGIIGYGRIAQKHIAAYRKLEDIELIISDLDPEKQDNVEKEGFVWAQDPDVLLASPNIAAIDVCVPPVAHANYIVQALRHHKAVFCEKPLVLNKEELQCVREAVNQASLPLMAGYLYRFHPAFQMVNNILQEGVIGKPHFALFRIGGRGAHRAWTHSTKAGGGAANEVLVHMLDLILWYFKDVKETTVLDKACVFPRRVVAGKEISTDGEDLVALKLRTQDDAHVYCQADLVTSGYMNSVEIHGSNGSIWTSILDMFPTTVFCKEERGIYNQGHNIFHFDRTDLFEKQLGHFVDCVRTGRSPMHDNLTDAEKLLKILDRLNEEPIDRL